MAQLKMEMLDGALCSFTLDDLNFCIIMIFNFLQSGFTRMILFSIFLDVYHPCLSAACFIFHEFLHIDISLLFLPLC